MFDGPNYPTSLSEDQFEAWLEEGRSSKIVYNFMLIVWKVYDEVYQPIYVTERKEINSFEQFPYATGSEALIAVYDLYSESRISID